jgi:hypothetical protein
VPVGSSNSQTWKVPWLALALVVVDIGHGDDAGELVEELVEHEHVMEEVVSTSRPSVGTGGILTSIVRIEIFVKISSGKPFRSLAKLAHV